MLERIHTVVAAANGMVRPIEELLHLPLVEPWVRTSAAGSQRPGPPGYYIHELGACRWDRPRHIPLGWLEPLAWLLQFVGYRWRQLAVIGLAEPNAHLNGTHAAGLLAGGISQRASGLGNPPKRSGL